MKTLKSFDLVTSEKKGKMVYYKLKRNEATNFIETANILRRGLMT
jgi:DNA-binding transcriptional ArsR family regulator